MAANRGSFNSYTFYLNADINQFNASMNNAEKKLIKVQQTANKGIEIKVNKSNAETLKSVVDAVTRSMLDEANASKDANEYINKVTQAMKFQSEFMSQYYRKLEQTASKTKKETKDVENAFLDIIRKVSANGDLTKVVESWDKAISSAQQKMESASRVAVQYKNAEGELVEVTARLSEDQTKYVDISTRVIQSREQQLQAVKRQEAAFREEENNISRIIRKYDELAMSTQKTNSKYAGNRFAGILDDINANRSKAGMLQGMLSRGNLSTEELNAATILIDKLNSEYTELKQRISETTRAAEEAGAKLPTSLTQAQNSAENLRVSFEQLQIKIDSLRGGYVEGTFDSISQAIAQNQIQLQSLNEQYANGTITQDEYIVEVQKLVVANTNLGLALERTKVDGEKMIMTEKQAKDAAAKLGIAFDDLQSKVNREKLGYIAGTFTDVEEAINKNKAALVLLLKEYEKTGNLQAFAQGLKNLTTEFNNNTTALFSDKRANGTKTITGDNFLQNMGKYARWYFGGNIITSAKRNFQEALEEMKAVDAELIQVKKVTDASEASLKKMGDRAYDVGKKYGVAASEYLEAVAAYSRAGMKENAEELAELSVKASLVGDMAQEDATKMFLAIQKSYGLTTDELSKVLDGLNELDNKHATTIENITEGMGKVASIASIAHVGIEELSAAIGTITAITQRSGTEAATALRALFLNIIGDTKTEIEEGETATIESINNIKDALREYAPEVVEYAERTQTVIDPMKAIGALAQAYKDNRVTEEKLVEILSGIGGKLRTSQLAALVMNWDEYSSQVEHFSDSLNSANREVANALDSWERKTQILKNTWTEFIATSVNSRFIKNMIDDITALIANIGSLGNALVILVGIIATFKMDKIFKGIETITSGIGHLKNAISIVKSTLEGFFTAMKTGKSLQDSMTAAIEANILAKKAQEAANTSNTASEVAQTTANVTETTSEEANTVATEKNTAATIIDTGATTANAGANAARAAAVSIATAAVALLTMAVIAGVIAHNKYEQKLHDAAEKTGELAEASYKEADEIYNLYRAYLYCEQGSDAQKEASEKLKAVLEKEGKTVEDLSEAYKGLTKEKLEEAKASAAAAVYAQSQLLEEEYSSNMRINTPTGELSSVRKIFEQASSEGIIQFNKPKRARGGKTSGSFQAKSGKAADIAAYYQVLTDAHKELLRLAAENEAIYESQVFKDVEAALDGFGDAAEEYLERIARKEAIIGELESLNLATGQTGAFGAEQAATAAADATSSATLTANQNIEDYIDWLRKSGEYTEEELSAIREEWERFDDLEDIEKDCRNLLDAIDDTLYVTEDGLDNIATAAEKAKSAVERFNDALKEKNTDALESYVKLYKELMEAADKGAYGSVAFQEGIRALFSEDFINSFNGDWAAIAKEAGKFRDVLSDADTYAVGLYDYWAKMADTNPQIQKLADGTVKIGDGLLTIQKGANGELNWLLDADNAKEAAEAIKQIEGITGTSGEFLTAVLQGWTDFAPGLWEIFKDVDDYLIGNKTTVEATEEKTGELKDSSEEVKESVEEQKEANEENKEAVKETTEAEKESEEAVASISTLTSETRDAVTQIQEDVLTIHGVLAMIDEIMHGIQDATVSLEDGFAIEVDYSQLEEATTAAGDTSAAIGDIPTEVTVSFPLGGFESAISAAGQVTAAINAIPSSKTVTIYVRTAGGGASTGGSSGGGGDFEIANTHGGAIKATTKAEGTQNFQGGMAFVNDEPGGYNPELIVNDGRAFIANGGNPAFVYLKPGAQIYNADETRAIMAGGTSLFDFPAYALGGQVPGAIGNKNSGSSGGGGKRSKGGSDSGSDREENEWFDLLKEYMEELYEQAEDALDQEKEAITAQILALKYQQEQAEKANELEEKRLDMIKAENDLLDAQHERTVRYFNAQTGQWEWMADQKAVLDAQEALADAQKDYLDAQYDYLEDLWKKIEDEIDDFLEERNDLDIESILNDLSNSEAGSTLESVKELIEAIKDFTASPTAGMELKQIASVYDSGGIASGVGFMPKGSSGNEVVLDSTLTGRILSPGTSSEFSAFTQNLSSLLDMAGEAANPQSLLNKLNNVTNNNGGNTFINGVQIGSEYLNKPLSEVLSVLGIYANA